jgi:hypothetical protein
LAAPAVIARHRSDSVIVAGLPSFAVDVPVLDLAYLADAEDQPFPWEIERTGREIAFAPPEPCRLHVLLDRGDAPPVWVAAEGEGGSLGAALARAKRAQLEARARELGRPVPAGRPCTAPQRGVKRRVRARS